MNYREIELVGSSLSSAEEWASLRLPSAYQPSQVSVIVPTHNRAAFLEQAVDSVWNQSYRPIELLVIDDGSSDNSPEAIRTKVATWAHDPNFRVVYIRQPNRGASAARNQGLLHSTGEFIQYLDSDDVLVCKKLECHVHALLENQDLDIVWSGWRVVPSDQIASKLDEANKVAQTTESQRCQPEDGSLPWEPWPTLTRRKFILGKRLWNEHVSRFDDWEYVLRLLAAQPKHGFVVGVLCLQRAHAQGRRQDYDHQATGVERGLIATRQAALARSCSPARNRALEQLLADRYWELFLEALQRGSEHQSREAITGALRHGRSAGFRLKGLLGRMGLLALGRKRTLNLLRGRYCAKFPQGL